MSQTNDSNILIASNALDNILNSVVSVTEFESQIDQASKQVISDMKDFDGLNQENDVSKKVDSDESGTILTLNGADNSLTQIEINEKQHDLSNDINNINKEIIHETRSSLKRKRVFATNITNNENFYKENQNQVEAISESKTDSKAKKLKQTTKEPINSDRSNHQNIDQLDEIEAILNISNQDKNQMYQNEEEMIAFLNSNLFKMQQNPINQLTIDTNIKLDNSNSCNQYDTKLEPTLHLTCDSDDGYDLNNINSMILHENGSLLKIAENINFNQAVKLTEFITNVGSKTKVPVLSIIDENSECNVPTFSKINKRSLEEVYEDELGITVMRAKHICVEKSVEADSNKENFDNMPSLEHLDHETTEDQNINQNEDSKPSSKISSKTEIIFNDQNLLDIDGDKDIAEKDQSDFAMKLTKVIFSRDELSNGIFVDKGRQSRSKSRTPLDEDRTNLLKEVLQIRLKISDEEFEEKWKFLKRSLNIRIYKPKKQLS